jgi:hypothetical protein
MRGITEKRSWAVLQRDLISMSKKRMRGFNFYYERLGKEKEKEKGERDRAVFIGATVVFYREKTKRWAVANPVIGKAIGQGNITIY